MITLTDRKFIKQAIKEAQKSEHNFRLGAIVVCSGNVVSRGFNFYTSHPSLVPSFGCSIHAEISALKKIKCKRRVTVYVARILSSGNPAIAKPCEHCTKYCKKKLVKRVVYTESNGNVGELKVA